MCTFSKKIVVVFLAAVVAANLSLNLFAAAAEMDVDGIERKRKAGEPAYGEREPKHRKIYKSKLIARVGDLSSKYGNKYANLDRLHRKIVTNKDLQDQLKLGGYSVEVPAFTGLSDEQGKELLQRQGLDVAQEWAQIPVEANGEEFLKAAQAISDKINQKGESGVNAFPKIPMLKHLVLKQIAEKSGSRLMVRSTGAEDTEQVSNAGGNDSVPNVEPTWSAITQASDKVMASYRGGKSLGQRTIEQDSTIRECSKSAVLYQKMIGEQEGGTADIRQIPVGCVVYTQEAYANTPGVTIIQASWGHNTGVVDNTVAVDTYTVDGNGIVNALIKIKPERWIPVFKNGKHKLEKVKNPQEIKGQPVLTVEDALAIKAVADAIQSEYGNVMDIELVYMPHEKKIYLVQARPLKTTSQFNPSYLQTLDGIGQENLLHGATVLPGNCGLRHITNKDHVVVANTLNDALTLFDGFDEAEKKAKQAAVQAIIVQGGAETTSHPAAIFRGAGKPVLVVQDIEKIRQWLQGDNVSVVVDIQRGVVVNFAIKKLFVRDGWFTHPMPKKITIPNVPVQKTQDAFIDLHPDKSMQELVEMLKCADQADAQRALDSILNKIEQMINQARFNGMDATKFEQLFSYACFCAKDICAKLTLPAFDLNRLYTVHFMECLLFQHEDDACVGIFSYESEVTKLNKKIAFRETLKNKVGDEGASKIMQNPELFDLAIKGFDCALVQPTEDLWINFVSRVVNADATIQQKFLEVAKLMIDFNALSTWINAIFSTTWKDGGSVELFVGSLYEELTQSADFLDLLKDLKQKIKTFDLGRWEDPIKFKNNLEYFESMIVNPCKDQIFVKYFEFNSPLVKLQILSLMDSFIDLFDQAIKALKGSTKYKNNVLGLVKNFKVMLILYYGLFEKILNVLPENGGKYIAYRFDYSRKRYLSLIKDFIDESLILECQIYPSAKFDVREFFCVDENNKCFMREVRRHYDSSPGTMEDIFSFIHTALLEVMGSMRKNDFLGNRVSDPEIICDIEKEISQLNISFQKLGTQEEFKDDSKLVAYKYFIPVRIHRLFIELKYDPRTEEEIDFKAGLYLNGPAPREHIFSSFLSTLNPILPVKFEKRSRDSNVEWYWHFKRGDFEINYISKVFSVLADLSCAVDERGEYVIAENALYTNRLDFLKEFILQNKIEVNPFVQVIIKAFFLKGLISLDDLDLIIKNVEGCTFENELKKIKGQPLKLRDLFIAINQLQSGEFSSDNTQRFEMYASKILREKYFCDEDYGLRGPLSPDGFVRSLISSTDLARKLFETLVCKGKYTSEMSNVVLSDLKISKELCVFIIKNLDKFSKAVVDAVVSDLAQKIKQSCLSEIFDIAKTLLCKGLLVKEIVNAVIQNKNIQAENLDLLIHLLRDYYDGLPKRDQEYLCEYIREILIDSDLGISCSLSILISLLLEKNIHIDLLAPIILKGISFKIHEHLVGLDSSLSIRMLFYERLSQFVAYKKWNFEDVLKFLQPILSDQTQNVRRGVMLGFEFLQKMDFLKAFGWAKDFIQICFQDLSVAACKNHFISLALIEVLLSCKFNNESYEPAFKMIAALYCKLFKDATDPYVSYSLRVCFIELFSEYKFNGRVYEFEKML